MSSGYQSRSATRVDLAGGTLDCWPLHLFVGDCVTVNLAISVYTGCELTPLESRDVEIEIVDLKYKNRFTNLDQFLKSPAAELLLLQKVIEYFQPQQGFRLKTYSQSPVGGGLGGSSSLCISLIKAFNSWLGRTQTLYEMVTLASNLEAKVIHALTGTQDYFPAIQPGLNVIHYRSSGVKLEPLAVSLEPLFENLMLVYTGRSHHSGINNWQVIKSVIEGDAAILSALQEIGRISSEVAQACRRQEWHLLPELFRLEYDSRIRLTSSFSSPEIDKLKALSTSHGAQAVKICGAGGGGCVLLWAEAKFHERIATECRRNGFQPINIQPVNMQP